MIKIKEKEIIKKVAKSFNESTDEVRSEMKKALSAAGTDMDICEFIEYVKGLAKERLTNSSF